MSTTLYRFFDHNERLLYVGISGNPGRRFSEHSKDKGWWNRVARSTMEHHPTREAAAAAEVAAIVTERPLHNVVHACGSPAIGHREPPATYRHDERCLGDGPHFFRNIYKGHVVGECRHDDLALAPEPHLSPCVDNVYGESKDPYEQGRIEVDYWLDRLRRDNDGATPETCSVYWSVVNIGETAPFQQLWNPHPHTDDFLTHFTWPVDVRTGQRVDFMRLPIRHRFENFARVLDYHPVPLQRDYPVGILADPYRSPGETPK